MTLESMVFTRKVSLGTQLFALNCVH